MTERRMLVLPAEPIDGYEVQLYWVSDGEIRLERYVYRVAAKWKDLFPEDDRPGFPFDDEWQVFEGEQFSGRLLGWKTLGTHFARHRQIFASEAEAVDFAMERAAARVQIARDALQLAERNLEVLRSVWAALPEKPT